ncbi:MULTISPECIES: fatty acid desaturase [Pseudomonas]|uniref:fatty acid desaturase n=1 Tax=Pseudomonas TaxID=286 RepID=UPI0015A22C57|nr:MULTISPECIES: fatty acid desaturase [Pseudomonas]NVZ61147.1 fatty acid desaturase [Pseudomonas gingeri]NVZ75288.1 fatty acid desaturase [Pseudomonas gingeri]NWA08165.1 fatty acid desaturase [Pseudomonas gingeri]NWE49191.1 fatty acid desaturase [Pseudomonas gingeri]NWE70832.1 fatty acid desaturase [Pseudomonas gingeri]
MPNYLDPVHREEILSLSRTFTGRTEWPTWLLLIAVHGGWFAVLLGSPHLGLWPSTLLLIVLVALWLSVQHELLHGHPTRFDGLNKLLGYAPFAVWYPYTLYRDSHLIHHRDEDLTLPGIDPESRYLRQQDWQRCSLFEKALHRLNKTVFGRLLVGAPLALLTLVREEGRRLRRGERRAWLMWLTHGALTVLMLVFVARHSIIPVWHYLLLVSIPALSVAMLRSYYEHRPHAEPEQRTVINEAGWPWSWLFLNNNLHLMHHDLPKLPWYFLPRVYRARRDQWLARSGGFLVKGYGELLRRHAVKAIDSPQHPFS